MSRQIVAAVLQEHEHLLTVPNGEKFEDRRRSLLVPIIDALPGGRSRWGILKKTGGVPSDVVTDLQSPTHEHFDVMSGSNLGDGTSRITAVWKSNGDYRRHSAHWRRRTLDEALAQGWIDPLPGTQEPGPEPDPDPQPEPGPTPEPGTIEALQAQIDAQTVKISGLGQILKALEDRVNRHLAK